MIHIRIDPTLLQLGPITVAWHGIWLAAGVLLGFLLFLHEGRKTGVDRDQLLQLLLWVLVCGFVGARLLHVLLYDWEAYAAQPLSILAVHTGGLSVYGALIGGTLAVAAYTRWKKLPFWTLADAAMLGIVAGEIVGRVGCTIAGDVPGVPTGGSWGLVYWHPGVSLPGDLLGVPTFPAPIAMQVWNAGLLLLLILLRRRARLPGALFLIGMMAYSAGRFLVNIWQPEDPLLWELKPTQFVALLVISASALALLHRRGRAAPQAKEPLTGTAPQPGP
jgi:phosphatidylglycerol:prolipoprotein diacylglycerol transferase